MPFIAVVLVFVALANPIIAVILLVVAFTIDYFWGANSSNKQQPEKSDVDWLFTTNELADSDIEIITPTITTSPSELQELPEKLPTPPHNEPIEIHSTDAMYMSAEDKALHLQSEYWKKLKAFRLVIANHACESCGSTDVALFLHHVVYTRLGEEKVDDVRIQCENCHSALHNKLGYARETSYPIA